MPAAEQRPGRGAAIPHPGAGWEELSVLPGALRQGPSGGNPPRTPPRTALAGGTEVRARADQTGPAPLRLTYTQTAPASQPAGQPPARTEPPAEESEYVRGLPDWARRFLRESRDQGGPAPVGTAREIAALARPEAGTETVRWTAPGCRPPETPITYREKRPERPEQQAGPAVISEAELQRTADRVYRIIEDRIRRERRRLGL